MMCCELIGFRCVCSCDHSANPGAPTTAREITPRGCRYMIEFPTMYVLRLSCFQFGFVCRLSIFCCRLTHRCSFDAATRALMRPHRFWAVDFRRLGFCYYLFGQFFLYFVIGVIYK